MTGMRFEFELESGLWKLVTRHFLTSITHPMGSR